MKKVEPMPLFVSRLGKERISNVGLSWTQLDPLRIKLRHHEFYLKEMPSEEIALSVPSDEYLNPGKLKRDRTSSPFAAQLYGDHRLLGISRVISRWPA